VTPAAKLLQPDSNPALYVMAYSCGSWRLRCSSARYTAWFAPDAPRLSPIRSLAYFRPVIDELRAHPALEGYLDYLRLKLRQAAAALDNTSSSRTPSWADQMPVMGGVWQILWGYAVIQDKRPATTARVAFRGSACFPFTL